MTSAFKRAFQASAILGAALVMGGCASNTAGGLVEDITGPFVNTPKNVAKDVVDSRSRFKQVQNYRAVFDDIKARAPELTQQIRGFDVRDIKLTDMKLIWNDNPLIDVDGIKINLRRLLPDFDKLLDKLPADFSFKGIQTQAGMTALATRLVDEAKNLIPSAVNYVQNEWSFIKNSVIEGFESLEAMHKSYGCENGLDEVWNETDDLNQSTIMYENPRLADELSEYKIDPMGSVTVIENIRKKDNGVALCDVSAYQADEMYQMRKSLYERGCKVDLNYLGQTPDVSLAFRNIQAQAPQAFANLRAVEGNSGYSVKDLTVVIEGLPADITCNDQRFKLPALQN